MGRKLVIDFFGRDTLPRDFALVSLSMAKFVNPHCTCRKPTRGEQGTTALANTTILYKMWQEVTASNLQPEVWTEIALFPFETRSGSVSGLYLLRSTFGEGQVESFAVLQVIN